MKKRLLALALAMMLVITAMPLAFAEGDPITLQWYYIYDDGVTALEDDWLQKEIEEAYNVKLEKFADENDCFYVDVASSLKDSTGGLKPEYCSDKYVHFTAKGCSVWVDVLKDYVG